MKLWVSSTIIMLLLTLLNTGSKAQKLPIGDFLSEIDFKSSVYRASRELIVNLNGCQALFDTSNASILDYKFVFVQNDEQVCDHIRARTQCLKKGIEYFVVTVNVDSFTRSGDIVFTYDIIQTSKHQFCAKGELRMGAHRIRVHKTLTFDKKSRRWVWIKSR